MIKKEEKGKMLVRKGGKGKDTRRKIQLITTSAAWVSKMVTVGRNMARLSRSTGLLDRVQVC